MTSDRKPMTEGELAKAEAACEKFQLPLLESDYEKSQLADEAFVDAAEEGWPRALAEVRMLKAVLRRKDPCDDCDADTADQCQFCPVLSGPGPISELRKENQELRTAIPFPGMRAKNLRKLEDDIAEIPLGREVFIELSLLADHLIRLDKLLKEKS